jgi:hypothetical protein
MAAPRAKCWLIDDVPQGTSKAITFVAALRHAKMMTPIVFDGPMTSQMFLAYVEYCPRANTEVQRYRGDQ